MSNFPVLAGAAAVQQRETVISNSREAIGLMIDAVRAAGCDAGNEKLLTHVQRIYVPQGLWSYTDPARLIADNIGAPSAVTVLAQIGILQQTLIGDDCERIACGDIDCALVVGGEAKFRSLQAGIQQVVAPEIVQQVVPDVVMQPDADLCLDAEIAAGLLMPVGFYAIIESALRFSRGESVQHNRDQLARRYVHFSEMAAQNPQAWRREVLSVEQVRDPVGKNRMLAFPYTKAHNSEWNVDQAAALLLCSEKLADAMGIAQQQRIYPLVSSESNHMLCLSQREYLYRTSGAELALQAALTHTGLSKGSFAFLDLYSCFPAAVQVFADALAVDDWRDLTVTGGMAQAGGPLNNYVFQATVRMAQCLREKAVQQNSAQQQDAINGLVSSVSGMLTKQAYGLWSTQRPEKPFALVDVSDEVAASGKVLPVLDQYQGAAKIAGYTVLYSGDVPSRAIAIADTSNGERVVVFSEEAETMQQCVSDTEQCGRNIVVDGNCFRFA